MTQRNEQLILYTAPVSDTHVVQLLCFAHQLSRRYWNFLRQRYQAAAWRESLVELLENTRPPQGRRWRAKWGRLFFDDSSIQCLWGSKPTNYCSGKWWLSFWLQMEFSLIAMFFFSRGLNENINYENINENDDKSKKIMRTSMNINY